MTTQAVIAAGLAYVVLQFVAGDILVDWLQYVLRVIVNPVVFGAIGFVIASKLLQPGVNSSVACPDTSTDLVKPPRTNQPGDFDVIPFEEDSCGDLPPVVVPTEAKPALKLMYPPKGAPTKSFKHTAIFKHKIADVMNTYWRKYKLPLPDPALPAMVEVNLIEEKRSEEWKSTFRRREMVALLSSIPYLVRRLLGSDTVTFVESSIQWENMLELTSTNKDFRKGGIYHEYSTYKAHPSNPNWSIVEVNFTAWGLNYAGKTLLKMLTEKEFVSDTETGINILRSRLRELVGPENE